MNEKFHILINDFLKKYPSVYNTGTLTQKKQLDEINPNLKSLLPEWYIDLLLTYPLAGAEIGIPYDFGQEDLMSKPLAELPLMTIQLYDLATLETENIEMFPGCELIRDKYICIGYEKYSSQEGIYIHLTKDDPDMLLVFHDMGETTTELIDNADKLLDKFSDLFRIGRAAE